MFKGILHKKFLNNYSQMLILFSNNRMYYLHKDFSNYIQASLVKVFQN